MGAWAPRRLQARGLSAVASFSRLGVAAARIWSKHRCRSAFHTLVARLLRNDTAAGTGGRRKKQTPGSPPFYIVRAGSFEEHCASLFRAIFTRFEGGDPPRVAHSATDDDDYTRTGLFPSPPSPWIAPPPLSSPPPPCFLVVPGPRTLLAVTVDRVPLCNSLVDIPRGPLPPLPRPSSSSSAAWAVCVCACVRASERDLAGRLLSSRHWTAFVRVCVVC